MQEHIDFPSHYLCVIVAIAVGVMGFQLSSYGQIEAIIRLLECHVNVEKQANSHVGWK